MPTSSSPPRWVRVLDLLCVLLFLLALLIALSGGFRFRVGGVRIALTSPARLLIWALAIGVGRHLAYRRAPIYSDVPARLRAWWALAEVKIVARVVAGTRPVMLFVGYMAVIMIGYEGGRAPQRLVDNELANLQMRWDTGWYMNIAVDGYSYVPEPQAQQNIVFFPAFPLLMRAAGRLLGGTSIAYVWGGAAMALIAFCAALVYLYRFARDVLADDDVASGVVWLVAAYPFAFFFSAAYTESIYLLGAVAAFYHFRRQEFGRAAAWGLLVGLTRPNGCFLSIPLAMLAINIRLPAGLRSRANVADAELPGDLETSRRLRALGAAAAPGVGMLLYAAYIWRLTGNPFMWAFGHAAWGREYLGAVAVFTYRYEYLAREGIGAYVSKLPIDFMNGLGALFVLIAAWPVARRFGLAYAVFILVNILPPLTVGELLSAGRFSSVLFPAFLWLATTVPAASRSAWVSAFMAVQAFGAVLFYTWRPLF